MNQPLEQFEQTYNFLYILLRGVINKMLLLSLVDLVKWPVCLEFQYMDHW